MLGGAERGGAGRAGAELRLLLVTGFQGSHFEEALIQLLFLAPSPNSVSPTVLLAEVQFSACLSSRIG